MDEPVETGRNPQSEYRSLITLHNSLTRRIRIAERILKSPDQVRTIDSQRHEVHKTLLYVAKNLGLDSETVSIDLMLNEGNLAEFGLPETPLIQLPITSYVIDDNDVSLAGVEHSTKPNPTEDKYYDLAAESLMDSSGNLIGEKTKESGSSWVTTNGNSKEYDKFNFGKYLLIVFAQEKRTKKIAGFETRIERMKNLAIHFNLQLYKAQLFHPPYDSNIYGVVVERSKLKEVADAMRTSPDKFWLTSVELQELSSKR